MSECYKCGGFIPDSGTIETLDQLPIWINITANAASSVPSTMKPFHRKCAPGGEDRYSFVTEAEAKRREAAARADEREVLMKAIEQERAPLDHSDDYQCGYTDGITDAVAAIRARTHKSPPDG